MEQCMDNTILWDNRDKINFDRVCKYFTHCSRSGITFHKKKFCFGRKGVEYLGFMLTP